MNKHLGSHLLTRSLTPDFWNSRSVQIEDAHSEIVSAIRHWFPELADWADEPVLNAYVSFWTECCSDAVIAPTYRDSCFLVYLYMLEHVRPDAFGQFLPNTLSNKASALRDMQSQWLGEPFQERR